MHGGEGVSLPEKCIALTYIFANLAISGVLLVQEYADYKRCGEFEVWVYLLVSSLAVVAGVVLVHLFSYEAIQRAWLVTTPLVVWGGFVVSRTSPCVATSGLYVLVVLNVVNMAIVSVLSFKFCWSVPRSG